MFDKFLRILSNIKELITKYKFCNAFNKILRKFRYIMKSTLNFHISIFTFSTLVAPEITVPSQLYGVGPGSNVTISCNVQAYPTAINYWMKDDNEMLLSG